MLDAISAAQAALLQDQLRLQSISQNVSNMQTPGYKRQVVDNLVFDEQLQPGMQQAQQLLLQAQEMQQGSVTHTRNPHDLALSGDGYFAVQTEKGVFYTRRGDFHVNEHGELASPAGALLLGQNGAVRVDDNAFTIDKSGAVFIDKQKADQIKTVQFAHQEQLRYLGEGLFATQELPDSGHTGTHILQGHLEQSNVKSMDEMLEMIKTSRHFQATQHVMHMADSLLSTAITQLGEGNV